MSSEIKKCCWCDEPILTGQPALQEEFNGEIDYYHLGCKAEEEDCASFDNDFGDS